MTGNVLDKDGQEKAGGVEIRRQELATALKASVRTVTISAPRAVENL